ncbi:MULTISPECIES: AraC family transcriptional regulator [Janthinobacterium]|uniref:helix-turn-helix transcriptional regulator n=1 Tax=Janthinobacterium TaxID=29580 RepID=UPI0015956231|nr:AraC family transcriptional regulator [Janthinobacterium sp. BJB401]NVI84565.1 helix-turn-helix transcriptional regulator [Janthinobacterium sp. BJB401]
MALLDPPVIVPDISAAALLADISVLRLGPDHDCRLTTVPLQDGIEVMSWKGSFEQPLEIALRDDSDRIHFTYPLQGNCRCWFEGGVGGHEHTVRINEGSINYGPDRRGRFSQQGAFESVTVMVRPDIFSTWLDEVDPSLRQALAAGRCFAEGHRGAELHATAHALSQALHPARTRLLGEPARHRLWLQAQGLAMVGLFLEGRGGTPCTCDSSHADWKLLQQARDRLLADLSRAPTLAELAGNTGLSVLRLKRGFRQMFGASVYGLFQQERMHDARRRLRGGHLSVMRVASDLGYTNASHFAAAFRKQFGVNPAEVKRGG